MSFPDFEKPFILHCDASELGLQAALCQKQDNKLKVISHATRTLTPVEKNYHLYWGNINILQFPNSDDMTSITKTQLLDSQQQDTSIKPVYQFVQLNIKPSKKEMEQSKSLQ